MATLSEVKGLTTKVNAIWKSGLSALSAIISKIAAIDAKAPNASETLASLQRQYEEARTSLQAQLQPAIAAEVAAFNTLSESDKEKANNSSAAAEERNLSNQLNVLSYKFSSVSTDKRVEISKANPPPPPPAPPTPVANVATAGNVAATGNAVANTNTNKLSGTADGDSGAKQANAAGTNNQPAQPPGAATTPPAGSSGQADPARTDGKTPQSDQGASANPQSGTPDKFPNETFSAQEPTTIKPGRRLKNPLGWLSSYTYQLSLYMITPDAYEAFVASGRKDISIFQNSVSDSDFASRATSVDQKGSKIKGGAYLVAQSGGITSPGEKRAPGFDYDYGIDSLEFDHQTTGKDTGSAVNNTNIKFKIYEPYGFSFISKLRKAQEELFNYTGQASSGQDIKTSNVNPLKQFFILGIRFYGYDANGRPVKGSDSFEGTSLDPNSSGTALFQTFYDLIIYECKTKLDGKMTVYDVKAANTANTLSMNLKKGMLYKGTEVSGSTVREALLGEKGLLSILNKEQVDNKKNETIKNPIKYSIEWIGDAKQIAQASIVSPAETDKSKQAGSSAKDSTSSTPATEVKSAPNNNTRSIQLQDNMPIVQCIEQIISRSQWLEDMLKITYTDDVNYDPKTSSPDKIKPAANAKVSWFNVTPKISEIKWDTTLNDWSFNITYQIQTYLLPVIDNPYVGGTIKFYGPHKRYDYWYTGENREILSYEQQLNALFFTAAASGSPQSTPSTGTGNGSNNGGQGPATAPIKVGDNTGSGDGLRSAAAASFKTSLYDPGSYTNATVTIMGDPDFLVQSGAQGINDTYNRFYGTNGFTINPTGGQVFFEIDFKEAIDYSSSSSDSGRGGTLSINDSIEFWRYPDEITKVNPETGEPIVKGVSYQLISLKSIFSGGQFKQILKSTINTFGGPKAEGANNDGERETGNEPETTTPPSPGNTDATPGAPVGTPAETKPNPSSQAPAAGKPPAQTPTSTSANDDAAPRK